MAINLPIVSKFDNKGFTDAQMSITSFQGIALGAFAKIGSVAVDAFASATRAAVDFGTGSIKAAADAAAVSRQLENAAKNSGAFGDTADSIKLATDALDNHSTALAEMSGIDDETINKLKSRWMAVPSIVALGTKGINNLAKVSADIAAATGKDIESIGLMFTKVAGDNETALSKLTRAGVVLSDGQKATYQSLLDTNKEAEAQAFLIDALATKYQGSAEAMSNPFDRMKVTLENLQETIGMAFLPVLNETVPKLQEFISTFVSSPEFKQFIADLGTNFSTLLVPLPGVLANLSNFGKDVLPVISSFFPLLNSSLELMGSLFFGIENTNPGGPTKTFAENMQSLASAMDSVASKIREVKSAWESLPEWVRMNPFEFLTFAGTQMTQGFRRMTGLNNDGTPNNDGNPDTPFALGGIVTSPTKALIGEAGAEAVIPLDRLGEMTGLGRNNGGGSTNIVINLTAGMGADGAALGEQIVTAIRKYERTSGAVFARA